MKYNSKQLDLKELKEKYPNIILGGNNFKYTFDKCPMPGCENKIPITHSDNMSVYNTIGYVYICNKHPLGKEYVVIDNKIFRLGGVYVYGNMYESEKNENKLHLVRLYRRPFYKLYKYWHRVKRTLIWYLSYKHIADSDWAKYGRFAFSRKKKPGIYYKKGSDIKRAFERSKYDINGFDLFTNNSY